MVGKANIVFLIFSEAAPGRSSRGGVLDFAPGGFPVIETDASRGRLARCASRQQGQRACSADALGCMQDGETLYGTAARLWGSARVAGSCSSARIISPQTSLSMWAMEGGKFN